MIENGNFILVIEILNNELDKRCTYCIKMVRFFHFISYGAS